MRQKISGVLDNPDDLNLRAFSDDAPIGDWQGELVWLAWGKSTNLFCYIKDIVTGIGYRLSVFWKPAKPNTEQNSYRPSKGGPAFDCEVIGSRYTVTTGKTRTGKSSFLKAEKIT